MVLSLIHCYNSFRQMSQLNEKKYSVAKAYRWKPKEYLSNTVYKRGKTFFSSEAKDAEPFDPFRKTETFIKTQNLKEFIPKGNFGKDGEERIKRRKASKEKVVRIERSPYLSNTSQIQKMLRLLVPVKGPNESLKLQIKRHNDLNIRNAQLLILKRSQNFQDRMKAYSSRMGLPQNSKIYMMNSRDRHIKEALNRRGWIESAEKDTILFHLKWVYKDNVNDYHLLQEGQLYNHFRNNQELTNKNYLRKNIKKTNVEDRPRFPMSYDLELNDDNTSFQQAYIKFEAFKVLNRITEYLSQKYNTLYNKVMKNPNYFCHHNTKSSEHALQKIYNILYTTPFDELKQNRSSWETLSNLYEYISYAADVVSKDKGISYSIFKYRKDQRQPYKYIKKIEEELIFSPQSLFKELSTFYICEIFKLWKHSSQICSFYGVDNMWILKPTGVSRGSGITITNDQSKITQLRYGKIVQKYIEHPLLLDCQRKFDIRQWVLVTSFSPIKAYAFKHCYARFSSVRYSNDKYQNMQKHLTNYSQNKQAYLRQKIQLKDNLSKGGHSSAMSEEQLSNKIGPRWEKIKQEYQIDIMKTLNACKSDIIHKQGCFEVFGFDIIIDKDYCPHILEVNLSPACEERQFLCKYLEEMANGLVDMIEGGEPTGWIRLKSYEPPNIMQVDIEKKVTFIQRWWKNKAKNLKNRRLLIFNHI